MRGRAGGGRGKCEKKKKSVAMVGNNEDDACIAAGVAAPVQAKHERKISKKEQLQFIFFDTDTNGGRLVPAVDTLGHRVIPTASLREVTRFA